MIAAVPPLPTSTEKLRTEVRDFLAVELRDLSGDERARSWHSFDREFSRKVGARGWIGMVWPKRYGGGERSSLERYVVLEELLAAGAPVGAHWLADRQSGPLLLRYGTEEMRDELLPQIARGELSFCVGMSEPDAGSDLAAVRSRAERSAGGWRLNGTKIWTTFAHRAEYMIGLFRTAELPPNEKPSNRHHGLSQFLIDLSLEGIEIRTIRDMTGSELFNEVVFRDVELAPGALLGSEGEGWTQAMAELALERSGPERYLSSFELLRQAVDFGSAQDDRVAIEIGRLYAELATLRHMSLGVATMLERGEDPGFAAAIVKDLGNTFEQRISECVHDLFGPELLLTPEFNRIYAQVVQSAPAFSLRGGTREILRSVIARALVDDRSLST